MALSEQDLKEIKAKKLRAVKNAFRAIEKQTGVKNCVYLLNERPVEKVQTFPSGSIMLDIALGVGGIALGRIFEIYGGESSGKTLTMLKAIGEAQKQGLICAFIDYEQTFSPDWAQKLGVNTDELILCQPDYMEQGMEVIEGLIDSGGVDFIVVDSVAAMVPKAELEEDIGKQSIALIARGMSKFLRRITPTTAKNKCSVAFINQIRDNVGVLYGNPTVTPGGRALKFYSSIRLETSKVSGSTVKEKIGTEPVPVGHKIRVKVQKNKVGPPFRKAEFYVYYDGRKVDKADELAEVILTEGLIPKYDAKGNISPNGRKYIYDFEDEHLEVNKKADLASALKECPKMQQHFIDMITSGNYEKFEGEVDADSELTEEEFEERMKEDIANIENGNLAEEVEGPEDWDDM